MKTNDAWDELRTTMEILKGLYDNLPGFEQSLAVAKAVIRHMNYLEEKYE